MEPCFCVNVSSSEYENLKLLWLLPNAIFAKEITFSSLSKKDYTFSEITAPSCKWEKAVSLQY